MENRPRGGILQRDGATYAIVPRTPAGIVSPEDLENIIKVVRRYSIPIIKMTSGQRMTTAGSAGTYTRGFPCRIAMKPLAASPSAMS